MSKKVCSFRRNIKMTYEMDIAGLKRELPLCKVTDDLYIGAPAVIGRNGVEKVIEINLNETEKAAFAKSAEAVRNTNKVLYEIGAL